MFFIFFCYIFVFNISDFSNYYTIFVLNVWLFYTADRCSDPRRASPNRFSLRRNSRQLIHPMPTQILSNIHHACLIIEYYTMKKVKFIWKGCFCNFCVFIIIIKKGWQCKAERERLAPYQSEDPNPTTPTHRMKEEKWKTAGDKKWANS